MTTITKYMIFILSKFSIKPVSIEDDRNFVRKYIRIKPLSSHKLTKGAIRIKKYNFFFDLLDIALNSD